MLTKYSTTHSSQMYQQMKNGNSDSFKLLAVQEIQNMYNIHVHSNSTLLAGYVSVLSFSSTHNVCLDEGVKNVESCYIPIL